LDSKILELKEGRANARLLNEYALKVKAVENRIAVVKQNQRQKPPCRGGGDQDDENDKEEDTDMID